MTRKFPSTIRSKVPALLALVLLLGVWQVVSMTGLVPPYLLPSPWRVARVFVTELPTLGTHLMVTLQEALLGLLLGVALGFFFAVMMDAFEVLYRALSPILVVSQTIPTVAIAPLLVLWFGYEMTPKIILVVLVTFFPVTVGLLEGFRSVDRDAVGLLRSMGAGKWQIFRHLKGPSALPQFFSGLRIAAAYSVVGAVISEWLGGFHGLGVYMTRVKQAFAFDKMFAVIFLISALSLALMALVSLAERKWMPYRTIGTEKKEENGNETVETAGGPWDGLCPCPLLSVLRDPGRIRPSGGEGKENHLCPGLGPQHQSHRPVCGPGKGIF